MKNLQLPFVLAFLLQVLISNGLIAQIPVSLVLRPDATAGKDAAVWSNAPNLNLGTHQTNTVYAWTNNSIPGVKRSLIAFDLSSVPVDAVILDAKLSLFFDPTSVETYGVHNGANQAYIQRITSAWDEMTVTWNTQPTVSNLNEVSLPASTSSTQNYDDIDVTGLVKDMVADPANSFGFMIKLQVEQYYASLLFASSDHADSRLHPKLAITYIPRCFTLQPDSVLGKDAPVWSNGPSVNMGSHPSNTVYAWTNSGIPGNKRSLIDFDLSALPAGAVVNNAKLSLYFDPNSTETYGVHNGANQAYIQRITSAWDEMAVTWSTQPGTTTANQVSLPASTNPTQDYLDIDVTGLVNDMLADPTNSYGFMIKLQNEQYYTSLLFASSDHPNAALHPKLDICWEPLMSSVQNEVAEPGKFLIYPNPSTGMFYLKTNGNLQHIRYSVANSLGQLIVPATEISEVTSVIDLSAYSTGLYFISVFEAGSLISTQKLVLGR